jgi:hypothetical protein
MLHLVVYIIFSKENILSDKKIKQEKGIVVRVKE